MKRQWLHDAAKFAAGLVAADFFTHWWLITQEFSPGAVLGIQIDTTTLLTGMVIDIFVFFILVHYGWHIGKIPQMKERFYLTAAGAIFTVIALGHLTRILYRADVVILGWNVPIFLSWIGIGVATYLAYASFHFATRRN